MASLFVENKEEGRELQDMLFQGRKKLCSFKVSCRTSLCCHLSIRCCPTGLDKALFMDTFFSLKLTDNILLTLHIDSSSNLKVEVFFFFCFLLFHFQTHMTGGTKGILFKNHTKATMLSMQGVSVGTAVTECLNICYCGLMRPLSVETIEVVWVPSFLTKQCISSTKKLSWDSEIFLTGIALTYDQGKDTSPAWTG